MILEYVALNDKIDELNDALDSIEKKNDDIHAQLLELLEYSKQFRKEIKERVSDNNEAETKWRTVFVIVNIGMFWGIFVV